VVFLGFGLHFRVTGRGVLHCQRCGGDRQYRTCTGRRWLHVLFVPVIALDRIPEHVQCTSCGQRYRIEVLAIPTTAQMQAALPAATRVSVAAMLQAGDSSSATARASAVEAVRAAGVGGYGESALAADLARDAAGGDRAGAVGALAMQLVMPAHEWFLADIIRVGLSDGQLSPAQREAAKQIAAYLGMTPAQAHGVIWMTEESAAAG